jgi:hypothetical protein
MNETQLTMHANESNLNAIFARIGQTVEDPETGELIEITESRVERYLEQRARIKKAATDFMFTAIEMLEERTYLAEFKTQAEFAASIGTTTRTLQKMRAIKRSFDNANPGSHFEEREVATKRLTEIGASKAYILNQYDASQFQQLLKDGVFRIGTNELDEDDIKRIGKRELEALTRKNKELQELLLQEKEKTRETELLKKEIEISNLKLEKLAKENERLHKEAIEFNPALIDTQAVLANISQAHHHFAHMTNQFYEAARRIEKSGNEYLMGKFCDEIELLEQYCQRIRKAFVHFFIDRS